MTYIGGKTRLVKHLLPIMLKERKAEQWWVEPFVGGGNMIDKVDGLRIGGDVAYWAIHALKSIRDHYKDLPKNNKEFTEYDYRMLKLSDDYKFKGYASHAFSFGAKFMGGWARNMVGSDYVAASYRAAQRQGPKLDGVRLVSCDYMDLPIPHDSLIYCDPPYAGRQGYGGSFDHREFWSWCRAMRETGHTVFVSEYEAPDDFKIVWEGKVQNCLKQCTKATERLFKI